MRRARAASLHPKHTVNSGLTGLAHFSHFPVISSRALRRQSKHTMKGDFTGPEHLLQLILPYE